MLLRNVGDPLYVVHSASSTPKTENNDTDISDNIIPTSATKEHQNINAFTFGMFTIDMM